MWFANGLHVNELVLNSKNWATHCDLTPNAGLPRGSTYTTIRELGLKILTMEEIMGPNSLMVVYVDPPGYTEKTLWDVT